MAKSLIAARFTHCIRCFEPTDSEKIMIMDLDEQSAIDMEADAIGGTSCYECEAEKEPMTILRFMENFLYCLTNFYLEDVEPNTIFKRNE